MSIIYRYWFKEFTKLYLLIQTIILVLAIFIDYISRLDKFLSLDIGLIKALGFILLKVPFFFLQLTPASILLAALCIFGLMNRNNELLALKSSGISVYHLIKPVLIAGAVLAFLTFFLGETLVPATMSKSNTFENSTLRKQSIATARKDIWIKSDNRFIHINFFDLTRKNVSGITIARMDDTFRMVQRIDAKHGTYQKDTWVLHNVSEQIYNPQTNDYDITTSKEKRINLGIKPDELSKVVKKSDEMSFFELQDLIQKVEREGYDATRYRTDLFGKIASPFICLIMVLTGAATGMRARVKDNLPLGIGIGVVIAFAYWVIFGFCMSLGYAGILPPIVAAWTASFIFLCIGVINLIGVE
ncbi:MAG: LPS export ABC transporter permease LptG [Desulfobacteraceae bacterium]|nr:MAG: LPS export ABC transporter permease LptG [Desulfobacteraceae bacterium]